MVVLNKVQIGWSGFPGGPGVNTFYVDTIPADLNAFQTFYQAIQAGIPSVIDLQVQNENVRVEETNGDLVGGYAVAPLAVIGATGGGDYAAGVGYCIRWLTGAVRAGRRVYGHTYLVPLVGSAFDVEGVPKAAFKAVVTAAANDLIANCSGTLGVWSRPKTGTPGAFFDATSAIVSPVPAILTSRRP